MHDHSKIEPTDAPEERLQSDSDECERPSVSDSRRRVVTTAVAAPALLVISGRSALAGGYGKYENGKTKGLSPYAWRSCNPKDGKPGTCGSHTVSWQNCGHHPGKWKPKKVYYDKHFDACWKNVPASKCKPFDKCDSYDNDWGWGYSSYDRNNGCYSRDWESPRCEDYRFKDFDKDANWGGGTKLPWLHPTYSCSQILFRDDVTTVKKYLCAAYLNAISVPGYVLTEQEVIDCAQLKFNGQTMWVDANDLILFLEQTFNPYA